MTRLRVVTHAFTSGQRDLLFGDRTAVERPELIRPWDHPVASWLCGPEPACAETVRLLGGEPTVVEDLAAPSAGTWAGQSLVEVQVADPDGLRAWLTDPYATPPEGESWAVAVGRVGAVVDRLAGGRSTALVVTGAAARALVAAVLGAGPGVIFRCDLPPLAGFDLTGRPGAWRLRLGA